MEKLKRFNKSNKKYIMPLVALCAVVAVVSAAISYAVYQKTDEILFINARVGNFETTSSDIELAMTLDGEDVDVPPSKGDYIVTVECDNADGAWNSEKWLAEVGNITSNRVKCNVNFATPEPALSDITATSTRTNIDLSYTSEGIVTKTICKYGTEEGSYTNNVDNATNTNCNIEGLELDTIYYYQVCAKNGGGESCKEGSIKTKPEATLANYVEIGDYISMTPTSTSYTLPNELSGCTGTSSTCVQNTINPSELNLWRAIKKNEDGTVEAVSEYASSIPIYFSGKIGYMNFIGGLNTIAAQYTNEKYVESTRHIGYSNQTDTLTDLSKIWYRDTSALAQWTGCNTSTHLCGIDEEKGAGDIGYESDYNLVNSVYGTMKATNPSGTLSTYWLSSRTYKFGAANHYGYSGRYVDTQGGLYQSWLYLYEKGDKIYTPALAVRPVIVFKNDCLFSSGDGKSSATAYKFE